ncbi:iron ABC transporter [Sphingobacterium sp. CZ-UAM]|uniref:ABC transporter ATP-binding protein n=1 Tax=Sphingobacterium sp. CZ-UAM TaxID=1933868 RepID=UPI000985AC8A|nr:ABC transporter ATP-binding protein [Sphingobacterium sp. CZ-UAM]OOG20227.1 iron ABC transporter [Sphingobacterium sp. CZ-UAM]
MSKSIHIKNLSFAYGKDTILRDVNVSFPEGKLSVILGRNGSGKSTLFNVIAGLEKHYQGSVLIGETERRNWRVGKSNALKLGFLNQFHQTTFPFKVVDVILTGRASFSRFSPRREDFEAVDTILEKFNLAHLKHKSYTSLSGGERQLVLLCRVLVQQPDLLLLDEPTNHLDLNYQIAVLQTAKELVKEGTTVLCVMHDPNMAYLFGDHFYLMQDNTLVDLQGMNREQVREVLEQTYELPLISLENQGKWMFVPMLHAHDWAPIKSLELEDVNNKL